MNFKHTKAALMVFAGIIMLGISFLAGAKENGSSNIFLDTDQDGLSNEEEKLQGTDPQKKDTDGDGYSDGAEIKSGYNPLKPAPGDKITADTKEESGDNKNDSYSDDNINLTKEVSAKVAGLISNAAGTEQKEISVEDLDNLVNDTLQGKLDYGDLPPVDKSEIKIKKQDYSRFSESARQEMERRDSIEYLVAVSYVAASNSPVPLSGVSDLENLSNEFVSEVESVALDMTNTSYFSKTAETVETALSQIKEIEVPENFLELHIKGMQLAKYAIQLKTDAQINPNDPLAGITSLSKAQNLAIATMDYAQEVNSKMKELGISEIPIEL